MGKVVKFKSVDDVVAAFQLRSRTMCKDMLEYAWDLGKEIKLITDEATYGEGAIDTVINGLGIGQSTLYAYRQFHSTYEDRSVIARFAENNISFRTVYKLLSIPDETRAIIEEKLISGEIGDQGVDDVKKALKQAAEDKKLLEEQQCMTGIKAEDEAPAEDIKYSKKVKISFYKVGKFCEKLEAALLDAETSLQNMDMISDDNLYSSVTDVMTSEVESIRSLFKVAEHWKDRVLGYTGREDEPEGK